MLLGLPYEDCCVAGPSLMRNLNVFILSISPVLVVLEPRQQMSYLSSFRCLSTDSSPMISRLTVVSFVNLMVLAWFWEATQSYVKKV